MADNHLVNKPESSDEIDLGQLFQLIRKGFNRLGNFVLRIFLYLKKNAINLGALLILGLAIGVLLKAFGDKRLKSEVIVKPNFDSTDYVYDAVEEIQSKINNKDTLFFKSLEMDVNGLKDFEITITPIEKGDQDKDKLKENNDYLDILQNYKDNDFVLEAVKSEVLKKANLTHRITFSHRNPIKGEEYVGKLMGYINSNPYFNELRKVYNENALKKVEENKALIKQIDDLVGNYTKQLSENNNTIGQERLVFFDKEKPLDVPNLLALKNLLIRENEKKQVEVVERREPVSIINFGKTQVVKKQFLNKSIIYIPAILIGTFFLWSFISYLNRKSKKLI